MMLMIYHNINYIKQIDYKLFKFSQYTIYILEIEQKFYFSKLYWLEIMMETNWFKMGLVVQLIKIINGIKYTN